MSNRQFFKRRTFVILLIGILIGVIPSALFAAAQTGTPTTYTISAGQSPGAPDWTVYVDGGYYWAKNEFGALLSSTGSTNASYVINTAITSLTSGRTWPETVLLHGAFTVANSIQVTSFLTLQIDGSITAASGMNAPILTNANPTTTNYMLTVEGIGSGGIINGNRDGQSSANARGISLDCHSNPPSAFSYNYTGFPTIKLKNLNIGFCYGSGLFVNFTGAPDNEIYCLEVSVRQSGASSNVPAVQWINVCDSYWENGMLQGYLTDNLAFYLMGGSFSKMVGMYVNGKVVAEHETGLWWEPIVMDNEGNMDTLVISGCIGGYFAPHFMSYFGPSTNTYTGIVLQEVWDQYNCTGNTFGNINFVNTQGTKVFAVGINETDVGQDYNVFYGIGGANIPTMTVDKSGTNSKADTAAILGTVG